ncbi:MAG: ABC transporter ATP-binding protein [Wenzhouxiangellaceae bacterium]
MALLEVRDLTIELPAASGWQRVVSGMNFQLQPGQIVGLVGESGSGKTLTGKALMGLLPPGARLGGEILMAGEAWQQNDEKRWRGKRGREVAMVFQDPLAALNPVRTIGSQLREVQRRHHGGRQGSGDLLQSLQRLRLLRPEALLRAYPHELSGGMRQRVIIAMAMLGQPRLLIADEPTAALDPTTRSAILGELLRLRDQFNCAILLISHELAVVERLSDELLVIYAGRMMAAGAVEAVLQDARHPYSAALMASRPRLDGSPLQPLPVVQGQFNPQHRSLPGCVFAPRCPRVSAICSAEPPPWGQEQNQAYACHHPLGLS